MLKYLVILTGLVAGMFADVSNAQAGIFFHRHCKSHHVSHGSPCCGSGMMMSR